MRTGRKITLSLAAALVLLVQSAEAHVVPQRPPEGTGADGTIPPRASPIYAELLGALQAYRTRWAVLPQVTIPAGPPLRQGQSGARVTRLRQRLGLPPAGSFDAGLAAVIRDYKRTHGLGDGAVVDAATIASLNRGASYYENRILLNLERARLLPVGDSGRYLLVDAAAARLWFYEDGKPLDSMRVIVGKAASETPMLAAELRYAQINPYWNVPPDLVQRTIAPRVLSQGVRYLQQARYEVLSDWTPQARLVDPATVDWKAVAAGHKRLRVRQLPGGSNAMGEIKFMMSRDAGIFLHDTPDKELFARDDRWLSNGCVRVEDPRRLARWLFGEMPRPRSAVPDEVVPLARPVPVHITYLTAATDPEGAGVLFRADPYRRDVGAVPRMAGRGSVMRSASID